MYFASVWFNITMATDRLSFASVEINKNYSLTLPGGNVYVIGSHVTSRNQGFSPNDKGTSNDLVEREPGNEVEFDK